MRRTHTPDPFEEDALDPLDASDPRQTPLDIGHGAPQARVIEPSSVATPALTRDAPLVPVDSAASRALMAVIAILTFLAALCAGAAEIVAANSSAWRASVAREATIQIRPRAQIDIEALVAQAAALARETPGVAAAEPYSAEESAQLLEPWLGAGLDLGELPVPRLVVVRLEPGADPDFTALRAALADIPGASLDDHGQWIARLSAMANTVVAVGVALVVLVLVAAGLAVAFATRGAMAGNREIVEVLHYVGADDGFIAREFQNRFLRMGLKGAAIGGGLAVLLFALFGRLSASWRASPAGDQIEALFGGFEVGWRGAAVIVVIALAVSGVTAIVSGLSVKRMLAGASQ
ncbi:cell division protein FtsX [Salinarimonas ramus]|uniref:Cell division protein FtsX n=1 Tax=Salinarimonas ramus TaxID=690164 RepID=A0A917V2R9_9HYPH|nr:ABC transporter permease [Salinarimonas ramus]GGK25365.1 cell division protein FtsX [Salinarimonas ramus]